MSGGSAKHTLTDIDIRALETIYADGRAQAHVIERLKEELRQAKTENEELRQENRNICYELKRAGRAIALLSGGRVSKYGRVYRTRAKSKR